MSWLVLGIISGIFFGWEAAQPAPRLVMDQSSSKENAVINGRKNGITYAVVVVIAYAAPVFGGMAMVGKMIHEFGVCTLLRE